MNKKNFTIFMRRLIALTALIILFIYGETLENYIFLGICIAIGLFVFIRWLRTL